MCLGSRDDGLRMSVAATGSRLIASVQPRQSGGHLVIAEQRKETLLFKYRNNQFKELFNLLLFLMMFTGGWHSSLVAEFLT